MSVLHAKQTGLPADAGDPSKVGPDDWYADHVVKNLPAPDGKRYNWGAPSSPNAKDDEFSDYASGQSGPVNGLDAKWSKHNLGTSTWLKLDDTYAPGCLLFDIPTGQSTDQWIYQAVPAGDFALQARMNIQYASDRQMWGPAILNSSGTGVGIRVDTADDAGPQLMLISAWNQTGTTASLGNWANRYDSLKPITLFLRKATNDFYAAFSWSDRILRLAVNEATLNNTFTAADIAFGRSFGSGVSKVVLDYLRVV